MTPARLDECLSLLRWSPDILAQCFGCDVSLIEAWLTGEAEIPMKAGVWLEVMANIHDHMETIKPVGLKGKRLDR